MTQIVRHMSGITYYATASHVRALLFHSAFRSTDFDKTKKDNHNPSIDIQTAQFMLVSRLLSA